MDEFELRLFGTGLSDGEITFSGFADLAESLQLLTTRIGRHFAGVTGPGRSPSVVERATALRLRATAPGSTILQVAVGEDGVLGPGLEHRSLGALLEIVQGIAADEAPHWVTSPVAEATVSVIEALDAVSTRCSFTAVNSSDAAPIFVSARTASRDVWTAVRRAEPARRPGVSVSGRLDLVDLRRGRLRVRDALGNDVQLEDVVDVDEAARLVGEQVTATGEAVLGARGQIASLVAVHVERLAVPGWTPLQLADVDFHRRIDTAGVDGVDDDEVTAFLELIGR